MEAIKNFLKAICVPIGSFIKGLGIPTGSLSDAVVGGIAGLVLLALVIIIIVIIVCVAKKKKKAKAAPKEAPAAEEKAEEAPAQEEAPAVEEQKQEEPVEEAPAQEEAPVEEEPATETPVEEVPAEAPAAEEEAPAAEITAQMIKDYVAAMTGEEHPVATVVTDRIKEKTPDSLKVKSSSMALLYGQDGRLSLLIRLDAEKAAQAKEAHSLTDSGFAGTNDYYKMPVDKSFKTVEELNEILEASYAYVVSKYFKVENGEYVELAPEEVEEAPAEEEVVEPIPEPTPVEEPEEEDEDDEEMSIAEQAKQGPVILQGPDGEKIYVNRTFHDRLCAADEGLLQQYSDLKNEFLSYRKVHTRVSKSNDAFRFEGKLIGKICVAGKGLKIYLALDPLSVDSAIYHQRDASSKKKFVDTPLVVKVKSPLSYRKAVQLITIACEKVGTVKKTRYEPKDWSNPNTKEDDED